MKNKLSDRYPCFNLSLCNKPQSLWVSLSLSLLSVRVSLSPLSVSLCLCQALFVSVCLSVSLPPPPLSLSSQRLTVYIRFKVCRAQWVHGGWSPAERLPPKWVSAMTCTIFVSTTTAISALLSRPRLTYSSHHASAALGVHRPWPRSGSVQWICTGLGLVRVLCIRYAQALASFEFCALDMYRP